jgi:putative sterol carrier protein
MGLTMSSHPSRLSHRAITAACAGILAFTPLMTAKSADPAPPTTADSQPLTDNSTPADVFESMRRGFNAAASKGVHAHYQFDISGPLGGTWWIVVNDGEFSMGKGPTEKPDVIMISTDKDWVMLATGSLGGFRAFITGRLKVTGDQGLAHKLGDIFP